MPVRKQYPIENSPLYKLGSRSKLAALIGVKPSALTRLSKNPPFNCFKKIVKGKERDIEQPAQLLLFVHKRLQSLLQNLESPKYLFSGKRGLSNIDNATPHITNNYLLSLDIAKFYPITKREYIFRFFHDKMLMHDDIAWLLTDLISFNGHIPTGSQVSQSIAYWSYSNLFDDVNRYAADNGITFTLYVDDIVFSSNDVIPESFEDIVTHMIYSIELSVKKEKVKRKSKSEYKIVTGVAISPKKTITIPNKQRDNIRLAIRHFHANKNPSIKEVKSLLGRIESARRIESNFCDILYYKLRNLRKKLNANDL